MAWCKSTIDFLLTLPQFKMDTTANWPQQIPILFSNFTGIDLKFDVVVADSHWKAMLKKMCGTNGTLLSNILRGSSARAENCTLQPSVVCMWFHAHAWRFQTPPSFFETWIQKVSVREKIAAVVVYKNSWTAAGMLQCKEDLRLYEKLSFVI